MPLKNYALALDGLNALADKLDRSCPGATSSLRRCERHGDGTVRDSELKRKRQRNETLA